MTRQTFGCASLDAALNHKNGLFELSPEMLTVVANRLESALADSRDAPLDAVKELLGSGLRDALAQAPEEVISAIRKADPEDSRRIAYLLGQLGMAHTVATRATDRRSGEKFAEALKSSSNADYVAALLQGELTNSELAERVGEQPETVSRKLKKLRDLGAADFRRDGQCVYNFLTPPAKAIAKSNIKPATPLPRPKVWMSSPLKERFDQLDQCMVGYQNFSTEEHPAVAAN